ncbi:MAG TPA: cytochrome c [Conexibacter sp.]|nr:cytochrome c [Conexibacter sp.]
MRPIHALPVVLVAVALAGAGCGGGGDSSSTSSAPPPATTQSSGGQTTQTKAQTKTTASVDGARVFATAGCEGCHTLAAAGSHGNVGPNLDNLKPSFATVQHQVENGGGGMPSFSGQLSPAEITAVARYVSSNAGK